MAEVDPGVGASDSGDELMLTLSSKEALIVEGLLMGLNQRQTSDFAGVHPKTVQRKLADPSFAVLVAHRRAERMRQLGGQLADASSSAVAVLRDAMSAEQPIKVRLAAARATLSNARDFESRHETDARIADLERVVARLRSLHNTQGEP